MKYKVGDLVKIKSKTWWNEQPKSKDGNIRSLLGIGFYSSSSDLCGRIGTIIEINNKGYIQVSFYNIYNSFQFHYWFIEEWIEKKIETWKIKLKLMKREL